MPTKGTSPLPYHAPPHHWLSGGLCLKEAYQIELQPHTGHRERTRQSDLYGKKYIISERHSTLDRPERCLAVRLTVVHYQLLRLRADNCPGLLARQYAAVHSCFSRTLLTPTLPQGKWDTRLSNVICTLFQYGHTPPYAP